jgi:hypothetical protein
MRDGGQHGMQMGSGGFGTRHGMNNGQGAGQRSSHGLGHGLRHSYSGQESVLRNDHEYR